MDRSENMRRIKNKNTKLERNFEKKLKRLNLKYEKHPKIHGHPDFKIGKILIFLDSCFWHGCPFHFKKPKTNVDFWMEKILWNIERDSKTTKKLEEMGYLVIRIWEHDLKTSL